MEPKTSIEVHAKTTEEGLKTKNAAFLSKYPTTDNQIDYYTNLAMQVFDEFKIDGTHEKEGVRKNVATWFENKRHLMTLLRKHPYWNEEAKAVVFMQDEQRAVDYGSARSAMCKLADYIRKKLGEPYHDDRMFYSIYCALSDLDDMSCEEVGVITDDFINRFNIHKGDYELPKDIARMLKAGTKITKFAHKCFTQWNKSTGEVVDVTKLVDDHEPDDRTYNSFDKLYAKFADHLSELTIKKITLVSLHFCDFMLMSNGNSWSSCHYINSHGIFHEDNGNSYSGCYKQGCLSYALDEPSLLLYTLPSTYKGEKYYREPKMSRMCCQYKDSILITGKCYPSNKDEYITRYRQTMQLILSTVENMPNLWTFSRSVDKITNFVATNSRGAHYRDYEMSKQKPTISICRYFNADLDNRMTIGHEGYCVHCGVGLSGIDEGWLQCNRHRVKPNCVHCGRRLEEDERIIIDGKIYCKDCCFFCDHHERFEPITIGRNELTLDDGKHIIVCNLACDDFYVRCKVCGVWHKRSKSHYSHGEAYCDACYQRLKADGTWPRRAIGMVRCRSYNEGDYVLMVSDLSVCRHGYGDTMGRYANKIMRIRRKSMWSNDTYVLTSYDEIVGDYRWSANCFAYKLTGDVGEDLIGKTMEEIQ